MMKNTSPCVQDLIKSGCVALKEWQPDDGGNLLHLATQHGGVVEDFRLFDRCRCSN